MIFQQLLHKKLILVSGKGGVGKTTISAALALQLAQAGKRVLLAEIHAQGQIGTLFEIPALNYEVSEIAPKLFGLNIVPMRAFEEYVLLQIRFHSLYSAVFDNRFVRYFIEAAPGLAELMCIGKVYAMVEDYDVIVVDAPATGHGKSLLQIPTIVADAVRVGPLKIHADAIEHLLRDPQRTALAAVTLPEEMPVAETLELKAWTQDNLNMKLGPIFLNGLYPTLYQATERKQIEGFLNGSKDEPALGGLKKSYAMQVKRSELHAHYQSVLGKEFGLDSLISIPYLFAEPLRKAHLTELGRIIAESS